MRTDYVIFIITHGRPNNQLTLNLLKDLGYTGDYRLVVDNLDKTLNNYIDLYGLENVVIFDKQLYFGKADTGLRKSERILKFPLYARIFIEDYAYTMGYQFFMVLDDDLTNIRIRYDEEGVLKSHSTKGIINEVFSEVIDFVDKANIACASFGWGNSYRSGVSALYDYGPRNRMCAETFIRNGKFKVDWKPLMIHDLLTSIDCNNKGQVWMQLLNIQIDIKVSEGKYDGGSSDVYRSFDKFRRVCFPLMMFPNCNYPRWYKNKWITTLVPENSCNKIISGRYRRNKDVII